MTGTHAAIEGSAARILNSCVNFKLRRASRIVTQMYDEALRPTGFRSTQLIILMALIEESGVAHNKLAHRLDVSPSSLTRALRPLMREGLVEVGSGGGRRHAIALTEKGREVAENTEGFWLGVQEKVTAALDDWPDLADRLDGLADAMRQLASDPA